MIKAATKRLNLCLGYFEKKQLEELCEFFQETPTPTIKRCINEMHKKFESKLKKER